MWGLIKRPTIGVFLRISSLSLHPFNSWCLIVTMEKQLVLDGALTRADRVVLRNLGRDIGASSSEAESSDLDSGIGSEQASSNGDAHGDGRVNDGEAGRWSKTAQEVATLKAMRNPASSQFEPTVLLSVDDCSERVSPAINSHLLGPYVRLARKVTRHQTDVVMITHLILYFTTLVPSAVFLYRRFSLLHGILHSAMHIYYLGSYTLMMHQHIHQRGILAKPFAAFDKLFPYILDPLMGHTWNSYYYHHVKHHHVENNGPDDLSSTLRFQRDSVADFLCYVGRFFFLVWIELPLYFLSKNRPGMAIQAAGCECLTYSFYCAMAMLFGGKATFFVYLVPLLLMRTGLMIGNWGQHAFVDADEPDSDFRSSITLIDVAVCE